MKISKFKIYHIILVVVFILALVFLKIIYDYVKKNKTTKKFN